MSKSKVTKSTCRLGSFSGKGVLLACMMILLLVAGGMSQAGVTYDVGPAPGGAPLVTNMSLINQSYQTHLSTTLSAIAGASNAVTNTIVAAAVLTSTTDNNAIFASALLNTSSLSTDIVLVSTGADPAVSGLTSMNAQENRNDAAPVTSAYSLVDRTWITSSLTNLYANSMASVSGNNILAETGLNKTTQTVDGTLNTTFNSSHSGTATVRKDTVAVTDLSGDAGLFIGSSQYNLNNTDGGGTLGYAAVTGTDPINTRITLTTNVGIAQGAGLSLAADNNTISSAFTGNSAENILSVQSGGATVLSSSAGIANLQINDTVTVPSTYSSSVSESRISALLTDAITATQSFNTSSLSFDSNRISASATGNVSSNELQIADSLNVNADGTQANSLDSTTSAEINTTSGGLFVNNMQLGYSSPVYARATDPTTGTALSVDSRGLISSVITADENTFEAIALGNDAYSSIAVAGSTNFSSAVAASNQQTISGSDVTANATDGALSVSLGTTGGLVASTRDNISTSTITVNDNQISALAVGNRDPLLVNINGTIVGDTNTAPLATDPSGTFGTINTDSLESTAGISAISSQSAYNSDVTATNATGGINLTAGNANAVSLNQVTTSTLTQSGNTLSSLANLNEGLVAVGVSANRLDASTAAASVQKAPLGGGTSNASATTTGTITTSVITNADSGTMTVLVGDGNLSDSTFEGNTISATAGGNLNATALEAIAATTMLVTGAVTGNPAASHDVLSLTADTGAADQNRTDAEMTVFTDQRLETNTVTASVGTSKIAGSVTMPVNAITLSNSTLNVDGNQFSATARGNLTSNSLNFSALAVDMTAAERTAAVATATGTNLASMGAVQVHGAGSVTATITANGTEDIHGRIADNDAANMSHVTNSALSVSSNSVTAQAMGSTAISSLSGTGGTLSEDVAGAFDGALFIPTDATTTALTIKDVAAGNAVVQSNAATVTANVATTDIFDIAANMYGTVATRVITNTTINADSNSVVAMATGSSANASTALDFNLQESSAATAVQQQQSGTTTANVGTGNNNVSISALKPDETIITITAPSVVASLRNTTVSASGNTVGAQATGATSTSSLTAGNAGSIMASGHGDIAAANDAAYAQITDAGAGAGTTTSNADYMLGVQQKISAFTTANTNGVSVNAYGDNMAGGSVSVDTNVATAQTTGGASSADLSLLGNDMTGGAGAEENTVNAVLSSDQRLSGSGYVRSDLAATKLRVQARDLTIVGSLGGATNYSETVSASGNTVFGSSVGLTSDNELNTTVATSVAGDTDGASDAAHRFAEITANVTGNGWDRLIVSNQDLVSGTIAAGACVGACAITRVTGSDIYATVTGGVAASDAINTDFIQTDNNTVLSQAVGGNSSNSITTTAGAAITNLSHAIVARQDSNAPVQAYSGTPDIRVSVAGNAINSTLSNTDNQFSAIATGLSGANTIALSSAAAITDSATTSNGATAPQLITNKILSEQNMNNTGNGADEDIFADIANATNQVTLGNTGSSTGSSLINDSNATGTIATGAVNTNTMTADSNVLGTATAGSGGVGFAVEARQTSDAAIRARTQTVYETLTVTGAVSGSSLSVSSNSNSANAINLSGANSLTADASTSNYGDTSTLTYLAPNITAGVDRSILSSQTVNSEGDVDGTLQTSKQEITITGTVLGGLYNNSSAFMNNNVQSSAATVAGNSNTLTNSANNALTSSSLIAGRQNSAAASTALTSTADVHIQVGVSTIDSNVEMNNNETTASATGVTADNTMSVSAGSISGVAGAAGTISAAGSPATHTITAMSAISSEQITSGVISSTTNLGHLLMELNAGGVSTSGVHQDNNLIQASAIAASASNELSKTADTSITNATAMLAASQAITAGSTVTATGSDSSVSMTTTTVAGSNMTSDGNTIQAIASGGYQMNDLAATSGTSISSTAAVATDTITTAPLKSFSGSYGLVSNQTSVAPVLAQLTSTPSVDMTISGAITANSSLSVSDNIVRSQATNLTADNTVITTAGTALTTASSGALNYQSVGGTTTATTTGASVTLSGAALDGAAEVDDNYVLALATGGTAANDVTVTATSIAGTAVAAGSTLDAAAAATTGGTTSMATLLNVQNRTAVVAASLADGLAGTVTPAAGHSDLIVSASFAAVTGSVSVSNNILAAEANGLVADKNAVSVASNTTIDGGGAALGSVQSSSANVTSSVNAGGDVAYVSLTATGLVTGSAKVDSNSVMSTSTSNFAVNSLNATAGTTMTNLGANTTTAVSGVAPATAITTSTVGFALQNVQTGTADTTSIVNNMNITSSLTSAAPSLSGTATVDNNSVLSKSRGQAASNSMVLNAATTLNASASLANAQSQTAGAAGITSAITTGNISLTAPGITGTTSVSNNTAQASSTANLALNSMDISGTLAESTGASTGSQTATANYVALNVQSNLAAVSGSISNFNIGLLSDTSNNGTASVLNNSIIADATGNSSTNTFTISPKGGFNTADFAFNGYQTNTGAISSTVSGSVISLSSTGVPGAQGTFSASGNRIGAVSIGNSSTSSIRSGR